MAVSPPTVDHGGLPPLEHPLEEGWALPARWYSDEHVLRAEHERIFSRSWQLACRIEQVREPGSFAAGRVGHVPIVVVRDREGVLRGFVNVCRHRNHLVASGEGCRATLQCPYHAWTYALDGSLVRAPRSDREPGFDLADFSLLPVAVDTWGPWVFANPAADAAPLADTLAGVAELVAESGVGLDTLVFDRRVEWDYPVNWKNALENYLECYHCAVAHPGLAKVVDVDVDAYSLVERALSSSQFAEVRAGVLDGSRPAPYRPHGEVARAQYHWLWPNTTINIEPGRPNLSIDVTYPTAAGRSIGFTDYWFGPDVSDDEKDELFRFSQQVGHEDASLVEHVQAGLDSGMVPQGRILPHSEQLIGHFQRLVHDALTG
jgi:choline monooxygenase